MGDPGYTVNTCVYIYIFFHTICSTLADGLQLPADGQVQHCMEVESFAETITKLLGKKELSERSFKTSDLKAFSFKGEAQSSSSGDHDTGDASKQARRQPSVQKKSQTCLTLLVPNWHLIS